MSPDVMKRFRNPEVNVGGGDMATRVLATGLLLIASGLVLPQSGVPYPLMKIALLTVSLVGLVSLMLGMFLRSKTYFAGFQLFGASLLMLWLASRHLIYVAVALGLLFIIAGIVELATRRSRLNALLGMSSFREPRAAEATLLEEALLPDEDEQKAALGAPLKPLSEGSAR